MADVCMVVCATSGTAQQSLMACMLCVRDCEYSLLYGFHAAAAASDDVADVAVE